MCERSNTVTPSAAYSLPSRALSNSPVSHVLGTIQKGREEKRWVRATLSGPLRDALYAGGPGQPKIFPPIYMEVDMNGQAI